MPTELPYHWPILPVFQQQALWHIHMKIEYYDPIIKKKIEKILIEQRLKISEFVPKDWRRFINKCNLNSKKQRLKTLVCLLIGPSLKQLKTTALCAGSPKQGSKQYQNELNCIKSTLSLPNDKAPC